MSVAELLTVGVAMKVVGFGVLAVIATAAGVELAGLLFKAWDRWRAL